MKAVNLLDIREYRVRLPDPLFPYTTKSSIEVCPFKDCVGENWLRVTELSDCFHSNFGHRNPLNVPGPFYGAETDTCGTGVVEAPDNVLLDERGQEYLFRQPEDTAELQGILSAAFCECFTGYGADGDQNWTLSLVREWWATRFDLLRVPVSSHNDDVSVRRWRELLSGGAEGYLRMYAFFVEEGRKPTEADQLPDLVGRK
jgi:hypothetical protein